MPSRGSERLVCLFSFAVACDRADTSASDRAPAVAAEPAGKSPVATASPKAAATAPTAAPKAAAPVPDAKKADDPPAPAVVPAVAPAPAAPTSPTQAFDELVARLDEGLASTSDDNATAWVHYKAKRYAEAARYFARVASKDEAWKHAHNVACALAMVGELDDARIALAESIRRGGDAARKSATRDGDLASARKQAWFESIVRAEPAADSPAPAAPATNCPPGAAADDVCQIDIPGALTFAPVSFDTAITLDLEIPPQPSGQRWAKTTAALPWKDLRKQLGVKAPSQTFAASQLPKLLEGPARDDPTDPGKGGKQTQFFWWPKDGEAILVILHSDVERKGGVNTCTLARKTAEGWRATTLDVMIPYAGAPGGTALLETGVAIRFDGQELFTLAQTSTDGEPEAGVRDRYLCRVRWEAGALARACIAFGEWDIPKPR